MSCVGVGEAFPANNFNTSAVIEHWNGSTWSLGSSAEPSGAVTTNLYGASCPETKVCFAVGDVGIGTAGDNGDTEYLRRAMERDEVVEPDDSQSERGPFQRTDCRGLPESFVLHRGWIQRVGSERDTDGHPRGPLEEDVVAPDASSAGWCPLDEIDRGLMSCGIELCRRRLV